MSEIFYTQVDKNLQEELNTRAIAAIRRSTDDINHMISKIANVRLIPYEFNSNVFSVEEMSPELGGNSLRLPAYLPTGKYGYLNTIAQTSTDLNWIVEKNESGKKVAIPVLQDVTKTNNINRIPPYLSSAEIQIGDHTMGLLNTAQVIIEIPNVARDLDLIEEVYMRPGRKIKMEIIYPNDAIITRNVLDTNTLPSKDKLKELYGNKINIDEKLQEISKMNQVSFEGLIVSFDLSYNTDFSATVSLQLRGTSNVLPEVTAFMNSNVVQENSNGKTTKNPITNPTDYQSSILIPAGSGIKSFYDELYSEAQSFAKTKGSVNTNGIIAADTNIIAGQDDDWILFGNAFLTTGTETKNDTKTYQRYITLGRFIKFINKFVISKLKLSVPVAEIICNSSICNSSYYDNIVSADPFNILLLPSNSKKRTTEKYGTKIFFESTDFGNWPGFLGNDRAYPARIFLNLSMIKTIMEDLEKNKNRSSYPISDVLSEISSKIQTALGGAIVLELITHPVIDSLLAFYDEKYLGQPETLSTVKPYHVPMHASIKTREEDSYGTIVHDFKMSAKLPDSAATLSYVLNQNPDEVSEEEIAPYLNTMYAFRDPDKLQKAEKKYAETHRKYVTELETQKIEYGKNMTDETIRTKLQESLKKYLQYPYEKLGKSNQAIAPIFPWDVSFTIDGINGFRYGDVLTFDILPNKYVANTVFSIIGLTHTVTQDGQWKTDIKCIMRPKLDK